MTAEAADGESGVRSSIEVGAVLLRDGHGEEIRLSWDKNGQAGETRALAPGRYKIVGYRMVEPGSDGEEWMITATSANFGALNVRSGQSATVQVPASIQQSGRIVHRGGTTNVQMAFVYGKGGVTVYRNAARIPMPFRVVDASGRVVGSGNIEYG